MIEGPDFAKHGSVMGMPLLDFMRWAADSLAGRQVTRRLGIPTIQRDQVWKADRIQRLWLSVLEGMPIGAFLLQKASGGDGALELLDGQQRARTLALALQEPGSADRCLWVTPGTDG